MSLCGRDITRHMRLLSRISKIRELKYGIILLLIALLLSLAAIYPIKIDSSYEIQLNPGSNNLNLADVESNKEIIHRKIAISGGDTESSLIIHTKNATYTIEGERRTVLLDATPEKIYVSGGSVNIIYSITVVEAPFQFLGVLSFLLMFTGSLLSIKGIQKLLRGDF